MLVQLLQGMVVEVYGLGTPLLAVSEFRQGWRI